MKALRSGLAALVLLGAGCWVAPVRVHQERIEAGIDSLRNMGGVRCAPVTLANAEAELAFSRYALDAGYPLRALEHAGLADDLLQRGRAEPCCQGQLGPDRDGDGIVDRLDKCPDEPEDKDGFQDEDGCPDPDNDADTVPDTEDRCPNQPGDPKNHGCPVQDRDGDGIPDDVDKCPDIAEDINGVDDTDGCPEGDAGDTDKDGIPNASDACPTQPEDKDGFKDEDGCPDPDNDLDGVLDVDDRCPLQPGPASNQGCPSADRDNDGVNDDVDQCPDLSGPKPSGCPKKVLGVKTAGKIEITQQINFATGKAIIRKNDLSFEIINQVASVIKADPTIKVVIEGHTDGNGPAPRNLRLSDDRANAVRQALIDRGVEPARLSAVGYGESKPIATNATSAGRSKNRRVVFTIVQPPTQ